MVPGLCLWDSSTHLNCELFLWLARKLVKVFGGDWLAKQAFFFFFDCTVLTASSGSILTVVSALVLAKPSVFLSYFFIFTHGRYVLSKVHSLESGGQTFADTDVSALRMFDTICLYCSLVANQPRNTHYIL